MSTTKSTERVSVHALKTIPALVGTQLLTRVISFSLKVWTIRSLVPEQVAFSDVQLVLFSSLSLLPWREGFRPTSLRLATSQRNILNWYLTCGFYLTCLIGLVCCVLFWRLSSFSLLLWSMELVAICLEAFSDTFWVQLSLLGRYKERAFAEGMSLICCTSCLGLFVHFKISYWIAVPCSHIAYSLTLNLCFMRLLSEKNIFHLIHPMKIFKRPAGLDSYLWITFYSVLRACPKFLLGDGENIILILLNDAKGQGNYKFAANLSSLILRFLFRPLEEQAHIVFSRYSSDFLEASKRPHVVREWKHFLCPLLRVEIVLCLCLCALGPWFIPDFVALFFGNQWESAVFLLECYSYYIFAMGLNGLLEAFYTSVGDTRAIVKYTYYSWFVSLCYLGTAYYLSQRIGIAGLVIANIANMLARSGFCFLFAWNILGRGLLLASIPSTWFWVCFMYAYTALAYLNEHLSGVSLIMRLVYRTLLLVPLMAELLIKECHIEAAA